MNSVWASLALSTFWTSAQTLSLGIGSCVGPFSFPSLSLVSLSMESASKLVSDCHFVSIRTEDDLSELALRLITQHTSAVTHRIVLVKSFYENAFFLIKMRTAGRNVKISTCSKGTWVIDTDNFMKLSKWCDFCQRLRWASIMNVFIQLRSYLESFYVCQRKACTTMQILALLEETLMTRF